MRFLKGIGLLLLILVRGCALWVMFPFAFVAWLFVHSWVQKASLRQVLCWYHAQLVLLLVNGPSACSSQLKSDRASETCRR